MTAKGTRLFSDSLACDQVRVHRGCAKWCCNEQTFTSRGLVTWCMEKGIALRFTFHNWGREVSCIIGNNLYLCKKEKLWEKRIHANRDVCDSPLKTVCASCAWGGEKSRETGRNNLSLGFTVLSGHLIIKLIHNKKCKNRFLCWGCWWQIEL